MKEKNFQMKIKKEIKDRGGWCVKFFANAYTQSGVPDILACYNGRFIGIEAKGDSKGYGATALQKHSIEEIKKAGGIGIVLCPEGWGDFLKILDAIDDEMDDEIGKERPMKGNDEMDNGGKNDGKETTQCIT